jgi:hypothetical protein
MEVTAMTASAAQALLLRLVLSAALFPVGCAARSTAPTVRDAGANETAEQYPLIVRLEGRHYSVSACSGPHGVVYTAHGHDGRMIVANASLDELRQRHPQIYQQILPGIAEKGEHANAGRRTDTDAEPDASIDGPVPMGRNDLSAGRTLLLMDASR